MHRISKDSGGGGPTPRPAVDGGPPRTARSTSISRPPPPWPSWKSRWPPRRRRRRQIVAADMYGQKRAGGSGRSSPSFKGAVFQLLVLPSFRPVGQVLRESIGEERGSRPSSAICQSLAVCKVCRNSGPPHVLRHKVHLALVALIVGTRLACSIVVDESRDGPGATEIQGGPPGRGYVFVDFEISMRSLYS